MGIDVSKLENWLKGGINKVSESPIGNMVESAIGSVYDRIEKIRDPAGVNNVIKRNEFEVSLLILAAAVIKADKEVSSFELEYVRGFLLKNFDNQFIEARMFLLDKILDKKFELEAVCKQINEIKPPAVRRQLVQFLFYVADADMTIDSEELKVIEEIAAYFELEEQDFRTIATLFNQETNYTKGVKVDEAVEEENNYAILGVPKDADENTIRKAYRTLAKKYHPDSVAHLGEKIEKAARERFLRIKEAYDKVMKK